MNMSENEEYDFEGANGGSSPRCPQGTYEITVQRIESYNTTRDDLPPAKLYSVTFTVDAVLAGGEPSDDEFDKNPLTAVIPGDVRGWRAAIDKTKKINEKHRAEVCAFVPSGVWFRPGKCGCEDRAGRRQAGFVERRDRRIDRSRQSARGRALAHDLVQDGEQEQERLLRADVFAAQVARVISERAHRTSRE
jgi:hypothetical protein